MQCPRGLCRVPPMLLFLPPTLASICRATAVSIVACTVQFGVSQASVLRQPSCYSTVQYIPILLAPPPPPCSKDLNGCGRHPPRGFELLRTILENYYCWGGAYIVEQLDPAVRLLSGPRRVFSQPVRLYNSCSESSMSEYRY
eukprot:COSAG01_NODE_4764_length_4753_cov_8.984757_7_plen_142_part_00